MVRVGNARGRDAGVSYSSLLLGLGGVTAILVVLVALTLLFREHAAEESSRGDRRESTRFLLPMRTVEASEVLGKPRAMVRDLLGTPTLSDETIDSFNVGIPLEVRYEGDIAAGLSITASGAARHERQVRRWLKLPPEGPIQIGSMTYRFSLVVGDDNRLSLNRDPVSAPSAASRPVPAPAPQPHAEELIRSFPNLPLRVTSGCKSVAGGRALTCGGFDAKLSIELNRGGSPISMTVLDSPNRTTEADCRAGVESLVEGARHVSGALYSGTKVDATYAFHPYSPGRAASCSLMVCRKVADLAGDRSPCGAK